MRGASSARLSAARPSPSGATVGMTSIPSRRESSRVSMWTPACSASSLMFRQSTSGRPHSSSWEVRLSARLRFLASATWTMTSGWRSSRMSRVTRSSSECGCRLLMPGVSMTVKVFSPMRRLPGRDLDGGARVVRDDGVLAGQAPEDDALADVRLADEDDGRAALRALAPRAPAVLVHVFNSLSCIQIVNSNRLLKNSEQVEVPCERVVRVREAAGASLRSCVCAAGPARRPGLAVS